MAKERTENYKFISRHCDITTYVSAASYLVELIAEKKAQKEGKKLPKKFWADNGEWSKFFRFQIKLANELLKDFSILACVEALKDYRTSKVYSLGARFVLDKVIAEYEKKLENRKTINVDVDQNNDGPRPQEKKNTILNRLEDLE